MQRLLEKILGQVPLAREPMRQLRLLQHQRATNLEWT